MKNKTWTFSETYENHSIDDYIDQGDSGPYWKVVSANAFTELMVEAKKMRSCVAAYHEYFNAIKRGDYETNRRTKPLRGFELMLQNAGVEALTDFSEYLEGAR